MTQLLEILSPHFVFRNALVASLLMGLLSPIVGRHLVFGRMVLLGLALPEISLTGIAFLFLGAGLGWRWCLALESDFLRASVGAMIFTIPTLLIIAFQFARQRTLTEGWLAFLYLFAVSITNLLLSNHAVGETYIEDLSHGRMLLVSDQALLLLLSASMAGALLSFALRNRVWLVLSDWEFARALRLNLKKWHVLLALINGTVIGAGVAVVGPLVTFGFLILPVLSAELIARSLRSHTVWSSIFGLLMGSMGFWISYRYDLPLGASIVAIGGVLLIATRLFQRPP